MHSTTLIREAEYAAAEATANLWLRASDKDPFKAEHGALATTWQAKADALRNAKEEQLPDQDPLTVARTLTLYLAILEGQAEQRWQQMREMAEGSPAAFYLYSLIYADAVQMGYLMLAHRELMAAAVK